MSPQVHNQMLVYQPKTLALAREAKGLTQAALAAKLGVSQARVSKLEDGLLTISGTEFVQWLSTLDLNPSLASAEAETGAPALSFYRRTTAIPLKMLRRGESRIVLRRMQIMEAIGDRRLTRNRQIPTHGRVGVEAAKELAGQIRRDWNLGTGPLLNLVQLVESTGCYVEFFPFDLPKIDAVTVGLGSSVPMIFLNPDFPPDRIRLSLAHEFGHLIMHREIRDGIEEEAWAFAGELLMPAEKISRELGSLSIERLLEIKVRWQVSMQAILKRAGDLKSINPRYYRYLWMRMGQYGFRKVEPNSELIFPETPTPLEQRITEDKK